MKVDFSQKLTLYQDGKLVQEEKIFLKCPKCGAEVIRTSPLTLRKIVLGVLFIEVGQQTAQQREIISSEEKIKRYKLGMRISNEDMVDLESDEIELIKKLTGQTYHPIIVGQIFEIFSCKEV